MPPVLTPSSPSFTRLWSCAGTIMDAALPSENAMQLHSSPTSSCSTTTSSPAAPKAPSSMISFTPCNASSTDWGMITPLPAASPLALTTTSCPAAYSALTYSQAASYSLFLKFLNAAVGRSYFAKKSFEKAFDASSSAAALEGPKHGMPLAAQASARPAQRGASGPTNTRATAFSLASATSPSTSLSETATLVMLGSPAVPPLPGAQYTCRTRGDSLSLTAIACSRPPPPTTSTSAAGPVSGRADIARGAGRCGWAGVGLRGNS
mmetsp:Transcript_58739/g.165742  ORF Transcript_58739/g.165742 Transcript_58739/m.165742 type:complete len:264 (+) Transcript_58739:1409-2200(+)